VRMGRHKLLLPWRGKTIIEQAIDAWRASCVDRVVVIVRPDDAELEAVVRACDVNLVIPSEPPPEMKDSVLYGLAHLEATYSPAESDSWLLAPADMPELSTAVIDRLLEDRHGGGPEILIPVFGKRRGHPVLFPWPLACQVQELSTNEGLNALVSRGPTRLVACDDPAILDDLDTPEDYNRLHDAQRP
jgi:molybdenum cofactor cytidylyltransferase